MTMKDFTSIVESKIPIITNWPDKFIKEALKLNRNEELEVAGLSQDIVGNTLEYECNLNSNTLSGEKKMLQQRSRFINIT